MAEHSRIRTWNGQAATFVDAHDGKVVVTVEGERKELSEAEWDSLTAHDGEVADEFNKAKP